MSLQNTDPKIFDLIQKESRRQETTLEMIASENHVSAAVMEAMGSCLTNKYAEGYPGARYYQGCGFYDEIENLARDRAKELFGCQFVNEKNRPRPGFLVPDLSSQWPARLLGIDR